MSLSASAAAAASVNKAIFRLGYDRNRYFSSLDNLEILKSIHYIYKMILTVGKRSLFSSDSL